MCDVCADFHDLLLSREYFLFRFYKFQQFSLINFAVFAVDDRNSAEENEIALLSVGDVDIVLHYVNQWVQRFVAWRFINLIFYWWVDFVWCVGNVCAVTGTSKTLTASSGCYKILSSLPCINCSRFKKSNSKMGKVRKRRRRMRRKNPAAAQAALELSPSGIIRTGKSYFTCCPRYFYSIFRCT